jgi:hypothetical protein
VKLRDTLGNAHAVVGHTPARVLRMACHVERLHRDGNANKL